MDVLLKRELKFEFNKIINISIYTPVVNDDGSYSCSFQISGFKSDKIRKSVGVDGVQAVILSLKKIGSEFYSSDEYKDKKITWECELFEGDLGFPNLEGLGRQ